MVLLITLAELSELGILGMRTSPPAIEGKDTASVSTLNPGSWGGGGLSIYADEGKADQRFYLDQGYHFGKTNSLEQSICIKEPVGVILQTKCMFQEPR